MSTTIGILSIGQMGLGIAQLLKAHHYRVITNISARSDATKSRAESAGIELFDTDEDLVRSCCYILSIVPPRDAIATAKRVEVALANGRDRGGKLLYYLDLNAISPSTVKTMARSFEQNAPGLRFVEVSLAGHHRHQKQKQMGGKDLVFLYQVRILFIQHQYPVRIWQKC